MPTSSSTFPSALTDEQEELLRLEMMSYIRRGKLSKIGIRGMCRELVEKKDDDGNFVFSDARKDKQTAVSFDLLRTRCQVYKKNMQKYLMDDAKVLVQEAIYSQAEKAKTSSQSLKVVNEIINKDDTDKLDKPAVPPVLIQVLQQGTVEQGLPIGQDGRLESVRYTGHERPDTVDPLSDRRETSLTLEVVPPRHDKSVHGVHERTDTTEGSLVPDTEVPSEDPVDNNGGGDMGTIE